MNNTKKYVIIFAGNLSSYFASLNTIKCLCKNYDIDIYILYSKNNNYCHTGLFGQNKQFELDKYDIDLINNELGSNIKYFECIENLNNYQNYLDKYIKKFQNNIKWIMDYNKNQINGFKYENFMDYERTRKYIDQFVRTKYLYQIISKNCYDYIIRMRIDILYSDFIYKVFDKLDINKIPCLYLLDCLFVIEKEHFNFYNYFLDKFGTYPEKAGNNTYYLGPEPQFDSIVYSFFDEKDVYKIPFELTFSLFDNDIIYTYTNKYNLGIVYSEFCKNENIDISNYKEKFINNKNIIISSNYINIPQKYKYDLLLVYTLI